MGRGSWLKGPRPCGPVPTGPSSGSSAAICWRRASSSIATTTSSCSWPPTPLGPTSFSIGSSKSTWRIWSGILAAVGPYIDIIVFGDDLGMQNGPQMSRAMYRELFMPRHARLWRRAKELAPVKVMLHSCGGIRPLLPDLIEAGLDAVNPVQITCAGHGRHGPEGRLRPADHFLGRWLRHPVRAFQGPGSGHPRPRPSPGCDPRGTCLRVAGGFVFQQVHNVLADVPPENVIAMFDAVR